MKKKMIIIAAIAFIFMVAGTASAAFTEGNFYAGVISEVDGSNPATGYEGMFDFDSAMTEATHPTGWDLTDLGVTSWAEVNMMGISVEYSQVQVGWDINYTYEMYLAVEKGVTPTPLDVNMKSYLSNGKFDIGSFARQSWTDGSNIAIQLNDTAQGSIDEIAAWANMDGILTGEIVMDIYSFSWTGTVPSPDFTPVKTNYELAAYLNSGNLVMETRVGSEIVPIPGAVWLLGSGLLGLVGIRRKKEL